MNPELRVKLDKQMYMVRHDFKFNKVRFKLVTHIMNNLFQAFINAGVKNLPSVLRTSDTTLRV